MIHLLDGPAKGTYMLKRAPLFLRAVVDKDGKAQWNSDLSGTSIRREWWRWTGRPCGVT